MYKPLLNNGIASTNMPLIAEYDIAWWYKCQIEITMPTFTFYDLQKQPNKNSEINILRTVNLTVCIMCDKISECCLE